MEYTFSWGAVVFGLVILGMGGAMVLWHQQIGDNFARGMGSYEKIKLYGIIACAVGFLIMLNVHSLFLSLIANTLFGR